ncbi:MAG TPA: hypothetical protein VI382_03675, partial [Candidatus Manganitrophaceae bacterium]|nr:hypothetical protein [Candidatus Manganitrophaceae bacterium]
MGVRGGTQSGTLHVLHVMEKRVDAIFAGGGLTALAAAAILARRGKGVLVLDGEERLKTGPGGSPFEFASGPFLLLGFEERGAMEGFFSELRLPIPSLKKQGFFFKRISPVLQFVLPGRRLNLYAQQEEYIEELKREFGDQLPAIKSLLQEVGKYDAVLYPYLGRFAQMEIRGLGDRLDAWKRKLRFLSTVRTLRGKSADAFLAPFGFSPKFLGYLNLQSLFAFKKALAGISSFEFVLLVSALQKGGVRMVGGYPTLVRFFLKLIREQGGEVLQERKIAKIEMEGGKVTAAILDDKTRVSCRRLIITRAAPDPFLNFYFTLPKESVPGPMKENV